MVGNVGAIGRQPPVIVARGSERPGIGVAGDNDLAFLLGNHLAEFLEELHNLRNRHNGCGPEHREVSAIGQADQCPFAYGA